MKRVSFKVAKAIKDAGYPQGITRYLYNEDGSLSSRYDYEQWNLYLSPKIDVPYAMEVWLWLWREKGMRLSVEYARATETEYESWCTLNQEHLCNLPVLNGDPEDAIIAAIDWLVDNDLIK